MTKNIINPKGMFGTILCLALFASSFTFIGCSHFEEEDLFDQSAALRIVKFNEELQSRLIEQSQDDKYGWVIQYYVGSDDDYEGFNLFGKFYENGKVTLASNHRFLRDGNAGKFTDFTSTYEMLKEEGPVLAFNTWNDILTVFVDPVDPSSAPNNIIKDGEGMSGDQNLVFHGYEEDKIVFRGQRHYARVRFVPCDRPWQDYIKDTDDTKSTITNSTITSYYVVSGTDTLYFKNLRSGIITYCERVNDPLFPSTINCVFTPNGFSLQHRNHIKGTSFQDFSLTPDKTRLMSENDSVQVIATWDNYIVNARNTIWNFDQDRLTEDQKSLLTQINAELIKFNKNYSLAKVGLGRSSGNGAVKGLVVTFYTNANKSKSNTAGISLTTSRPSFGKMQILFTEDEKTDKNFSNIASKTTFGDLVRQFAATLSGTYDIIPNDYFLPTGCELHTVGGGNEYLIQ